MKLSRSKGLVAQVCEFFYASINGPVLCRETQRNDAPGAGSELAHVDQLHRHDTIDIPGADDKIEEILNLEITTETFLDCPKDFKFNGTRIPPLDTY